MLSAWVLSNLAVNRMPLSFSCWISLLIFVYVEENVVLMNSNGSLMALMEVLASSTEEETKEQALRALTNLSKNGTLFWDLHHGTC